MGFRVVGVGSASPETVVSNADLTKRFETSDEWIQERTGISQRLVGGSTVGLAVEAGERALEMAGWVAGDVDLLVLATTTPDQQIPASSASVAFGLGLSCGAFDLNAACSGFVYSLVVASGLLETGLKRVLVVGSDTLTRFVDPMDRGTAILFADGAGAVAVEFVDGQGSLLGWDLGVDGSLASILEADIAGVLTMDGREVFRQAVRAMVRSSEACLLNAGLSVGDVDLLVPHQANARILESACRKLGFPVERAVSVLDVTGNTSAASVPMALDRALKDGRLERGDVVLLVGFGAGMTWASAVLRW